MNTVKYVSRIAGNDPVSFRCARELAEKLLARDKGYFYESGYNVAEGKDWFTATRFGDSVTYTILN